MSGGPLLSGVCLTSEHIDTSLSHLSQRLMVQVSKMGEKKGVLELHLEQKRAQKKRLVRVSDWSV